MADTWTFGHVKHSLKEKVNYLFMPEGKWWKFEGGVCKITPTHYRDCYSVIELKPFKRYEWCAAGMEVKRKFYEE